MALTAPVLWLDGALVASSDASVPLMGHAAQRGSLVFDVGAWHVTSRGPALFRARDHVARFLRSARIVGLEVPFTTEGLVDAAVRVIAENTSASLADGLIRWSVFYAATEPDLLPREGRTRVAVAAQSLQDPPRARPITIATFDDARKAPPEVLSPETKAAAAYLGPMIARRRAVAKGADDVVLLDADGDIAEAPIANVFAVVGGTLLTPPLGRILPGITRDTVLALAREEGIPVREEKLTREMLTRGAEEAFLTATSLPLAPIGVIDDRTLPNAPGPITTQLLERLHATRRGTILSGGEHASWLTYVG